MSLGHPSCRERGFTLVEMIVALVVLSLILGLLASGARLLRGTGDRVAERAAVLNDAALLASLLHERLGDAVALDFGEPGKSVEASFEGTAERVRFTTLSLPVEPRSPLLAMEIGSAPGGGISLAHAELVATAEDFSALDSQATAEARRLLPDALGLRIDYHGRKSGERAAAWHAQWRGEPALPGAVRLVLRHDRLSLPPIIVPIRQDFATLCASPVAELGCEVP